MPQSVGKKQKGGEALFSSLHVENVGIATTNLNIISISWAKETCELDPASPKTEKSWEQWREEVPLLGVSLSPQKMNASFFGSFLLNPMNYFSLLYESDTMSLQFTVNPKLIKRLCKELFVAPVKKRAYTDVLLCRKEFRAIIRLLLSAEISSWRQNTRNTLFSSLGYSCLLSGNVAHSEQGKTFRAV